MNGLDNFDYSQVPHGAVGYGMMGGPLGPGFAIAMIVFVIVALVVSIVVIGIPLWRLAKRFNIDNPWMAWVPILQIFATVKIAGKPWWWGFAFILALVPGIGALLVLAFMAYIWTEIAKKTGHPIWMGILTIIPVVNLVIPYIIAFGKPATPAPMTSGTPMPPMSGGMSPGTGM